MTNPWRLTVRQCEVLEALVRTGCNKKIERELGFDSINAVTSTIRRVAEKVGVENRVQLAVAYDRWKTGRQE